MILNFKEKYDKMLTESARSGDFNGVLRALSLNADINAQDVYGMTALMWSAQGGHTDWIDGFIRSGADVHKKDSDGRTAVMHAAAIGHESCLARLIQLGARVNAQDHSGWTPAMHACASDHEGCLAICISAGADLLMQEANQETAWSVAIEYVSLQCIEILKAVREARVLDTRVVARSGSQKTLTPRL